MSTRIEAAGELPARVRSKSFDEEFDVVVVGYGYAGGIAAIEAADAGASVLLIEKMPDGGGISILSGGSVRCADNAEDAFRYLKATNAGTTPDDVLRVLADGMATAQDYVKKLADAVGATVIGHTLYSKKGANYPFPGWQVFYHTKIGEVPGYDGANDYPQIQTRPSAAGPQLFKVLQLHIAKRNVDVRYETAAQRLVVGDDGAIHGVVIDGKGGRKTVKARRAVILACGGFEANEEMKRTFWQGKPVLTAAGRGNTGDGIRMAQAAGAALWHMWHFHGTYGFKHPDPDYPYGLRPKRLPDWKPGLKNEMDVKMAWIVVDSAGKRFMNELPPYAQDTSHRPMDQFNPETMSYPRIPSWMICDEDGRRMYPLGDGRSNDREYTYDWSEDNLKEIQNGILTQVGSIREMAEAMDVDEAVLENTIERWNDAVEAGDDDQFGRPPGSMMPIRKPPYIIARVYPICSNTQGGPVHDARQRILDAFGQPIPRLYAAGELGSSFGHLYISGGNVVECLVTGRVAAREAAGLQPWR